jgi:hypothetical protein
MIRRKHVRYCLFAALLIVAPAALPEVGSPETLDSIRQDAMGLIQSGQRLEAAQLLLESLGSLPPDRADLAYPAIGCFQLLAFTNEYLMSEEECIALYDQSLHEDTNDMHRLIAILMRYMDDAGMTQEQANECSRELLKLTQSEHQAVRLGALFTRSSPYYYYDTKLGQRARDDIVKVFPNTYLAREAQRLNFYTARKGGAASLRETLELKDDEGRLRAHTFRMRADPVGSALYQAVQTPGDADATCVTALASVAEQAESWEYEYAALTVLDGFSETGYAAQVRDAATQAINRDRDARCTFRALTLRMSAARTLGDVDSLIADANALLNIGVIPTVPERNNYEEFRNHIQHAAEFLAANGRIDTACDLLRRMAGRFPDTLLASKVANRIAELQAAEEQTAE